MEKNQPNPQSEIAVFVKAARKALGLTQDEFAEMYNCTKGNVSAWENGRHEPTYAILADISAKSKITLPQTTQPIRNHNAPVDSNIEDIPIQGYIPLISWVAAGNWCNVEDPYVVGDAEEWLPCPVPHGKRTYAVTVRGESMCNPQSRPSFSEGEIIFVDPDREPNHRSFVVVRLDDENTATFKRLLIDGENKLLEALNPSWPERIIKVNSNATICGVVIARVERF